MPHAEERDLSAKKQRHSRHSRYSRHSGGLSALDLLLARLLLPVPALLTAQEQEHPARGHHIIVLHNVSVHVQTAGGVHGGGGRSGGGQRGIVGQGRQNAAIGGLRQGMARETKTLLGHRLIFCFCMGAQGYRYRPCCGSCRQAPPDREPDPCFSAFNGR